MRTTSGTLTLSTHARRQLMRFERSTVALCFWLGAFVDSALSRILRGIWKSAPLTSEPMAMTVSRGVANRSRQRLDRAAVLAGCANDKVDIARVALRVSHGDDRDA